MSKFGLNIILFVSPGKIGQQPISESVIAPLSSVIVTIAHPAPCAVPEFVNVNRFRYSTEVYGFDSFSLRADSKQHSYLK